MRTLITALTTFAACQAVRRNLEDPQRPETDYAGGRVTLTALRNEGAAFGLPIPMKVVAGASAGALALLWARRGKAPVSTGLVLGGGLSNLLERVKEGRVFDYLRFPKAPGKLRRYVYNLADLAILVGGLLWSGGKKR